jgi:hypothetical protein
MIAKCLNCKIPFYTKPSWVKSGGGKYCSLNCKYIASKVGENIPCFTCGKVVYNPKARIAK